MTAALGEDGANGRAVERHAAGIGAIGAVDQPDELRAAGADQSAETEHLALVQVETDVFDLGRARQPSDLEDRLEPLERALRRFLGGRLATHDRLDQPLAAELRLLEQLGRTPVAEDGDPVAEREDLLQPVRHVEHRHAGSRQVADDGEKPLALAFRQ